MKAKHQRLILALVALAGVAGAGVLAASALRDEAAYFRTPAEVAGGRAATGEAMRLGGMVAKGSIVRQADGLTIRFVATDGKASVPVEYKGIVPDLFGEESGMVADGRMRADGVFVADRILAKHDERYMPPQMGEMPKNMKAAAGGMTFPSYRHCEERSDEAIQSGSRPPLDCFASLAMTSFLDARAGVAAR